VPLDDPRLPTLMGNYKVPHFDAKGAAESTTSIPNTAAAAAWPPRVNCTRGCRTSPPGPRATRHAQALRAAAGVG
jgi:hypothetical protein